MDNQEETSAKSAIVDFLQRTCVFIVNGSEGSAATDVATGVVFKSLTGKYVILTARHFENTLKYHECRLGFHKCDDALSNFMYGYIPFDGDVDIALIVVKDGFEYVLDKLSLPVSCVPCNISADNSVDSFVLSGFPSKVVRLSKDNHVQGFCVLSYWCFLDNLSYDEKGRYQLEWDDAMEWNSENPFELPDMEGMSGGPLWRFRANHINEIWSPDRIGQIVGIQSSWNGKNVAYLEPVDKWGKWFHDSIIKLDEIL